MSTPFTTCTNAIDFLQHPDRMNEVQLAYSERRQALGQSSQSPLATNTDVQAASLFSSWQSWIESNCTSFIDHVNGPLNGDSTDFLYFTLATFRAAAGLNADGFRRTTDLENWLYGTAQGDDYAGCWLIEDIHKTFSTLKWTGKNITWDNNGEDNREYGWGRSDCWGGVQWELAQSRAETDYEDSDPTSLNSSPRYNSSGWYNAGVPYDYFSASLEHIFSYAISSGMPALLKRGILYLQGNFSCSEGSYENLPADGSLAESGNFSETIDADSTPIKFGSLGSQGIYWCVRPEPSASCGCGVTGGFILKWNFTNSN